jgi:hypothetical protein
MTALPHSTETTGNAKRVTIASVAATVAVFGMIALFSVAQSSDTQAPAVAMATAHQSELQGLLCRIDRRCPANEFTTREASSRADAPANAVEVAQPSDLSGLLCRIDRRCPAAHLAKAPTVGADLTQQSDLRGLLCRIDRRCPATGLTTREASQMQIAENTAR